MSRETSPREKVSMDSRSWFSIVTLLLSIVDKTGLPHRFFRPLNTHAAFTAQPEQLERIQDQVWDRLGLTKPETPTENS